MNDLNSTKAEEDPSAKNVGVDEEQSELDYRLLSSETLEGSGRRAAKFLKI